jgi:phosphoglucomutase
VAYEIQRSKLDGAINFTASHNPAQYHGLKFSSADAGPALPEVTKDIEARVARIIAKDGAYPTSPAVPSGGVKTEKVNLRENYLKRLGELVRFETLRKKKVSFVTDALHGCGAGYLDKALADHGVAVQAMRTNRDCLFDGTGPDVSEENLAPLRKAVMDSGAAAGLATDGDADRFGMIDRDGTWIQPNHILALVYDYIVETRGWTMAAARSVATSQLIDAAATAHGQKTFQTPVGFKYIGQLIREDKIALGGEESGVDDSRACAGEGWNPGVSSGGGDDCRARGFAGRASEATLQESGPGILAGTRKLALERRTKGKRCEEGGGGRFDTAGAESSIGRPHRRRKIQFRGRFVDVAAAVRDGTAAALVCGSE